MSWRPGRGRERPEPTPHLIPLPPPEPEPVWTPRLHAIGQALDAFGPLRDVTIMVTGERAFVTGLGWFAGTYHTGLVPISLVIEAATPYLLEPVPGSDENDPMAWPLSFDRSTWRAVPLPALGEPPAPEAAWAPRLRAVGQLLDREPIELRDPCLIDVGGGVVVEAMFRGKDETGDNWKEGSREFTAEEIAAELPKPRRVLGVIWSDAQ
jgi:hypothetical protein